MTSVSLIGTYSFGLSAIALILDSFRDDEIIRVPMMQTKTFDQKASSVIVSSLIHKNISKKHKDSSLKLEFHHPIAKKDSTIRDEIFKITSVSLRKYDIEIGRKRYKLLLLRWLIESKISYIYPLV